MSKPAIGTSMEGIGRTAKKARHAAYVTAALLPLAFVPGCSVHVQKGDSGQDKDVSIRIPFANVQVHKDQTGPVDIGLPAYPGAVLSPGPAGDDKAVDVKVGFAEWQVHVQVLRYTSPDPQAKIEEFYRKALGRYGAVLTCRGDEAVGTPTRTGEGLTCRDDRKDGTILSVSDDSHLELKAGSERRQHILSFDRSAADQGSAKGGATQFSLIALNLPALNLPGKGEKEEAGKEE